MTELCKFFSFPAHSLLDRLDLDCQRAVLSRLSIDVFPAILLSCKSWYSMLPRVMSTEQVAELEALVDERMLERLLGQKEVRSPSQ